jgi:hypothetical protein
MLFLAYHVQPEEGSSPAVSKLVVSPAKTWQEASSFSLIGKRKQTRTCSQDRYGFFVTILPWLEADPR